MFSTIFVARSGENRSLGRPARRWEDNIKMGLKEIEYESVN
jgi:hypothetical protein